MSYFPDAVAYDDLPVPREALANGGVEMLRVGVVADELFVTARRAFDDPAQWGELLALAARRLGMLYAVETAMTEADASALIATGFAATLGFSFSAPIAKPAKRRVKARPAAASHAKSPAKPRTKARKSSKPAARRKAARAKS